MDEYIFSAIVPAAGVGKRLASSEPKAWVDLEGEPIVVRTLRRFIGIEGLQKFAVAVLPEEVERRRRELSSYDLALDLVVCAGGRRRQDSVEAALQALGVDDKELIVIHDAARPFVSASLIIEVAARAAEGRAAIAAILSEDTIKEVDENGLVRRTAARKNFLQAQTPQAIRAGVLRRGLALAGNRGIELTDDAGAAELLGFEVEVVPGRKGNFKITTAEDLAVARLLLRGEGAD